MFLPVLNCEAVRLVFHIVGVAVSFQRFFLYRVPDDPVVSPGVNRHIRKDPGPVLLRPCIGHGMAGNFPHGTFDPLVGEQDNRAGSVILRPVDPFLGHRDIRFGRDQGIGDDETILHRSGNGTRVSGHGIFLHLIEDFRAVLPGRHIPLFIVPVFLRLHVGLHHAGVPEGILSVDIKHRVNIFRTHALRVIVVFPDFLRGDIHPFQGVGDAEALDLRIVSGHRILRDRIDNGPLCSVCAGCIYLQACERAAPCSVRPGAECLP